MRKSTFYKVATLGGVGALFSCFVMWDMFFGGCCRGIPVSRVDGDFSSIGSAIKMYAVNSGRPPSTGQGLSALVNAPAIGPKPKRWSKVMDRVPLDPWATPYRYQLLSSTGARWRWELRSAGPDRAFGSGDDFAEEFESGVRFDQAEEEDEEARPSF